MKDILYIDLDGVIVDYYTAANGLTDEEKRVKGFFENLNPIEGAIEAVKLLIDKYDVYILSTAPWTNIHSWSEKRIWVEKYFGDLLFKKLILTHNKGLLKGKYLIDDRIMNGVDTFEGQHIHYGTEEFKNWDLILKYLNV